jgi:hypothetical protein
LTVNDIIDIAEVQTEESYEASTWMAYINEALDDLTPVAKIPYSVDIAGITITAGSGSIILASAATELLTAHELLNMYFTDTSTIPPGSTVLFPRLPFSDLLNPGWKYNATTITLQGLPSTTTEGKVTINYYKKLVHVTTTMDDLASKSLLPVQYHPLVAHYCIAKSQQKEEELSDKQDAYSAYIEGKRQMAIERIWEMEPYNRPLIRQSRIAMMVGGK